MMLMLKKMIDAHVLPSTHQIEFPDVWHLLLGAGSGDAKVSTCHVFDREFTRAQKAL
ncbi:hypothetical protein EMIT0P258_40091 [Pseudomonas sp. IT-P258]